MNIKKIILSLSNNTMNGFIVIRENSIEKYGFQNLDQDELKRNYSKIIIELKSQNQKEVAGKNDQEAVNELRRIGKICIKKTKFILNITNKYTNDMCTESIINYSDGSKESIAYFQTGEEFSDLIPSIILELCQTYEITINDNSNVLQKLVNLDLLTDKNYQKNNVNTQANSTSTNTQANQTSANNDVNNLCSLGSSIKNIVLRHKITSIIALLIITYISLKGCSKKNITTYYPSDTDYDTTIEQIDNSQDLVLTTNQATPTYTDIISFKDYDITSRIKPSDDSEIIIDTNGRECVNQSLSDLYSIRNYDMSAIGNYIQSNIPLDSTAYYIFFENYFNYLDIRDRAAIKYFSTKANEIIENAYSNKDLTQTNNSAKKLAIEIISIIRDNKPIKAVIYGQEDDIFFNELSNEAKEAILNIVWSSMITLGNNSVGYYGETITLNTLYDAFENAYDQFNINK